MSQSFRAKLLEGEILFRDRLQFELKSEFRPDGHGPGSSYLQEFYIFAPVALQINSGSYNKQLFYQDQTQFIRLKTPEMELSFLLEEESKANPLYKIEQLIQKEHSPELERKVLSELKLLANIYRSSLRERVAEMVDRLDAQDLAARQQEFVQELRLLLNQAKAFRERFGKLGSTMQQTWGPTKIDEHYRYVHSFKSHVREELLIGLLEELRRESQRRQLDELAVADEELTAFVKEHAQYVYDSRQVSRDLDSFQAHEEHYQYERGLLKKFVLDALLLRTSREEVLGRYTHAIGAFAAATAMVVYLTLFVWQLEVLVNNSTPFILTTTVLYVLKDRIKDGIKLLWARGAVHYFPDFATHIVSPRGDRKVGELRELFSFIRERNLPRDIKRCRNREFHHVLEAFKRPETVLYTKKEFEFDEDVHVDEHHHDINVIFRFSIRRFLEKLSEPYSHYVAVDQANGELVHLNMPKVYHLNIIVKNTVRAASGDESSELKKFRVILDKQGIKRVERVT